MPELRSKIPKRIGVLLSRDSLWEIIFCFHEIEKNGYMRLPISFVDDTPGHPETKNNDPVLNNLSRIEIIDSEELKTGSIQALIMCSSKNEFNSLCNFEVKGEAFGIDLKLRAFLRTVYRKGLPIGAFGYAVPLLVKAVQGITKTGPIVTVGNDPRLQSGVEAAGAQAITTRPTEVIIDNTNMLVTSGGQLASKRLTEVAADCENMFKAILELLKG
jgi:enhancing lycopene biosynthesis protein 2